MSDTTDQTVDVPEQEDVSGHEAALEQRARNMGWRPREEFRGDPERWMPADQFVERGERLLPLLQERNRAADRMIVDLQRQVADQGQTLAQMLESTRKAEQVGYRRAVQELNQQRTRAVEMGDRAAFEAVEQAIRELGPPPPDAPPRPSAPAQGAPQANNDPVIVAWVSANPWFRNDPVANVAMIAAMQQEERRNPGGSVEDHLADAERAIAHRFPEHFPQARRPTNGNGAARPQARRPLHVEDTDEEEEEPVAAPPRRQAAPVSRSSDSPPARRPGPRSFEALPRDVQQQYERQRKMLEGKGDPFTKEEFARYYFEQEAE